MSRFPTAAERVPAAPAVGDADQLCRRLAKTARALGFIAGHEWSGVEDRRAARAAIAGVLAGDPRIGVLRDFLGTRPNAPCSPDQLVSRLQEEWTGTAGAAADHSLMGALQGAAAERLGTDDAMPRTEGWRAARELGYLTPPASDGFAAVLDAQYAHTQEWLRATGVEILVLVRGMSWTDTGAPDWPAAGTRALHLVPSRPLASWTCLPVIAQSHALGEYRRRVGVGAVVLGVFPASRVFALSRTGMGSSTDREVVLTGGTDALRITVNLHPTEEARWPLVDILGALAAP